MNTTQRLAVAVGAAILIAGPGARAAGADTDWRASSFAEARTLAAASGSPILIKIGGGACSSCKDFDAMASTASDLQKALAANVVLLTVTDGEGEGRDLSRMYSVYKTYPTFLLVNSSGDLMDRWSGYYKPEDFISNLSAAVKDPLTVGERRQRFIGSPNELDARKFGELAEYAGNFAEAVAYYRRAAALNPASDTRYDVLALNAMGRGAETGLFTMDEVRVVADRIVAVSSTSPMDFLRVAFTMGKVAHLHGDLAHYIPYLKTAVERTASTKDEMVQGKRGKLLVDYALLVEKDEKKAVTLQKTQFASWNPRWTEDATQLNNFAWWCFENKINLAEADRLARKGVELAEPGIAKANILDTVAEICNLKGDCGDAVHFIELAVAEAPGNQYFQKQLDRFQDALALSEAKSR